MSSLSGRIVLLGTGALAGNTLWDKDSAGQVLNSLKGFLPKAVEGGAVAGSDARLDQLSADVRAIMMSNRQGGTVVVSQGGSGMSKVRPVTHHFQTSLRHARPSSPATEDSILFHPHLLPLLHASVPGVLSASVAVVRCCYSNSRSPFHLL